MDLLVMIDLVRTNKEESFNLITFDQLQSEHRLEEEQVAEYKEVFMLFDRDEDGVLSFQELQLVMKSMGQRPPGD